MNCLLCNQQLHHRLTVKQLLWPRKIVTPVICQDCRQTFESITGTTCPVCCRPQDDVRTCRECRRWRQIYPWRLEHRALYRYNEAMKEFMHRYKFMGDYRLHAVFSSDLVTAIRAVTADLVVPIPVTAQTMTSRGFNQVVAMVGAAAADHCLQASSQAKVAQSSKSRLERLQSKQPFILTEPGMVSEKRVLLVDDVYTTGRTLYHAAELMYSAGAASVVSLSLAR